VFLNVLVAVDGSPAARRALAQAVDVARAMNSALTLITVAPAASTYVALAGFSTQRMQDELDRWAERQLRDAQAAVPADVIAHVIRRRGHPGPEILAEVERGTYDLVVLGTRGRGAAREGLFGSVNAYLHFHSQVPLLSVPGEPAEAAVGA
jgi:nucleotide-binding universal stress UspA family protein